MSFWCHRFDQNSNENIVRISALKVFIASLGLPGSFFGLPVGFLINNITDLSPQEAPRKQQKFQGRIPYNIFAAILVETMTPKRHFEIN